MEGISLRTAQPKDLDILLQFEQGVVEAERPFESTLKPGTIHYYDIAGLIQSNDSELIIACLGDEVIGSGYARMEKAKPFQNYNHHAYLGFMYVKPEYRGKGVGQKIMEGLMQWSRSKGIRQVRLDVYHDNIPAVRAYEKAGFQKSLVRMNLTLPDNEL